MAIQCFEDFNYFAGKFTAGWLVVKPVDVRTREMVRGAPLVANVLDANGAGMGAFG